MHRVGVIGGGQLAWMMGDAAKSLGLEMVVQTPAADDPAVAVATSTILASIDDISATAKLAEQCDLITFENEFVNLESLAPFAQRGVCFYPSLKTLAPLLDKYHQRCYLQGLGLPVPPFRLLELGIDEAGWQSIAFPCVCKARRHGYDGQGTFIIPDRETLEQVWLSLNQDSVLLEAFVPFDRELAVVGARSVTGEVAIFPITETQQEKQVCRRVLVPADVEPSIATQVESIAHTLLTNLQAVGVFGIELFLTTDGKVLINEIAPRTHNSGHFTLDACETSQFEQHFRAICAQPLGSPALKPGCKGAVMVNLLGYEDSTSDYATERHRLAEVSNAHVYWYGKASRPDRKLGHVTVVLTEPDRHQAESIAQTLESIWYRT